MSDKLKAVIVDDEESARNILFNLLQLYKADIEVVAQCENVEQAVATIQSNQANVIFLDIEMPNYSGLELVSFFKEINFEIIFITAYQHFAVKAFEVSAFDYLLKPIEINRLDQSIKNLLTKKSKENNAINYEVLKDSLNQKVVQKMIVNYLGNQKAVVLSDVVAIEANEAYSVIHDKNGMNYTMSKNLKHFENLLEDNKGFMRVHKSWIVNQAHITHVSNADYLIFLNNKIEAKLSKYKKAEFDYWFKGK